MGTRTRSLSIFRPDRGRGEERGKGGNQWTFGECWSA